MTLTDIALIAPNNASATYQGLANEYSAIEPPTWALIIAESLRVKGFKPAIVDTLAEALGDQEAADRIAELNPKLILFVVYGQNVNAGTTNMSGAIRLAEYLKVKKIPQPIGFVGSHVQALPKETMEKEKSIDFVCLNEGVYSLIEALSTDAAITTDWLEKIGGLAVRGKNKIVFTGAPKVVSSSMMDVDMPGYAWDLLPYGEKPLDLYRSPYWHANYQSEFRSPYASIQTSLGCQFRCSFCMINLINKNDAKVESVASEYSGMRHWSAGLIKKEFEKLISMNVHTIRIADEMFLLNRKYYMPIVDFLIEMNTNDKLKIWVYSRIDTVPNPTVLKKLRLAGIRWLCLGIESADKKIRLEVAKGKFEDVDVKKVVAQVEASGINVMANYIYGLPGDTEQSIENTYQLSVDLNTLGWNTYAAMALPGSPLYQNAKEKGIELPKRYEQFSFHSYETLPLATEHMEAHEILKLRDLKYVEYFSRPEFKAKVEATFGKSAVENIEKMNEQKLEREIFSRFLYDA